MGEEKKEVATGREVERGGVHLAYLGRKGFSELPLEETPTVEKKKKSSGRG